MSCVPTKVIVMQSNYIRQLNSGEACAKKNKYALKLKIFDFCARNMVTNNRIPR